MITQMFSMEDVDNQIQNHIKEKITEIITTLEYIGVRCANDAREKKGYTDQTANLDKSIGYMVLNDGIIVSVSDGRGGSASPTSKEFMNSLIAENSKGIILIVVAGMNYAFYVEATGRNVLTSAELLAERIVPEMLKELGFKIK